VPTVASSRLAGHGLVGEGWPFTAPGVSGYRRTGEGMGRCECGDYFPVLPSTAQRQRWHCNHKNDIRSERGLKQMDTTAKEGQS
jgi:hypothetical protein